MNNLIHVKPHFTRIMCKCTSNSSQLHKCTHTLIYCHSLFSMSGIQMNVNEHRQQMLILTQTRRWVTLISLFQYGHSLCAWQHKGQKSDSLSDPLHTTIDCNWKCKLSVHRGRSLYKHTVYKSDHHASKRLLTKMSHL